MRTFKKSIVYHLGLIDKKQKNKGSYEGSGLSVSEVPSAWRSIARLGGNPTQPLHKANGEFVDYHSLTRLEKQAMINWGVDQKLIESCTTYYFCYYDDEYEEEFEMTFSNKAEAEIEAGGYSADVNERQSYVGTPLLSEVSFANGELIDNYAIEQVIIYFLEVQTNFDGVWWNDKLDVQRLSAPRGVIFNKRLKEWRNLRSMPNLVCQLMLNNEIELAKKDKHAPTRMKMLSEVQSYCRLGTHNLFKADAKEFTVVVGYNQLAICSADDYQIYTYPTHSYNTMCILLQKLGLAELHRCFKAQILR